MATVATRRLVDSHKFQWTPTLILGLLGVAVLAYIAVVPAEFASPQMNEAAWFALGDQMVVPESANEGLTSQAISSATPAAAATDPARRNVE